MIVHLRQIGDRPLVIEGAESAAELGLEEAKASPSGDLEYRLEAGRSGGGLWVRGLLRLPVRLLCVGCLEPFETLLEIPEFCAQIELDGSETIDLTPWVREDILLALPPYPKCDASGEKKCPAAFPPVGNAAGNGPAPGNPSAWAALDQIKIKK